MHELATLPERALFIPPSYPRNRGAAAPRTYIDLEHISDVVHEQARITLLEGASKLAIVQPQQYLDIGFLISGDPLPRRTAMTIHNPAISFRLGGVSSFAFPLPSLFPGNPPTGASHLSFDEAGEVGRSILTSAAALGVGVLLVASNNRVRRSFGLHDVTIDAVRHLLDWVPRPIIKDRAAFFELFSFINFRRSRRVPRPQRTPDVERPGPYRTGSDCAGHLSPERIEEYLSDVLPSKCRLEVLHHLDGCADCNGAVREQMPHGERDH